MKLLLLSLLTVGLIAAGFFLFPDTSPEPVISPICESSVVVAFGDSITFGTGASSGNSYPDQLSQMTGIQIINEGIPGETVSEGLVRLPEVVERYDPQLILLCQGGNDMLRGRDKKDIARDLDQMLSYLKERTIDVILIGVPAPGISMSVPDFYGDLAEKHGLVYEKEILEEVLSNASLKNDYIHPDEEGYRVIAEKLWTILSKAVKK